MGHAHSISENPGKIAGIAAMSAAIGAVTAMLFTPRTGSQTRDGIRRRAAHGKDTMMDRMHSKKDEVTETIDTAKDKASDIRESAKDKAKDLKSETKAASEATKRTRNSR